MFDYDVGLHSGMQHNLFYHNGVQMRCASAIAQGCNVTIRHFYLADEVFNSNNRSDITALFEFDQIQWRPPDLDELVESQVMSISDESVELNYPKRKMFVKTHGRRGFPDGADTVPVAWAVLKPRLIAVRRADLSRTLVHIQAQVGRKRRSAVGSQNSKTWNDSVLKDRCRGGGRGSSSGTGDSSLPRPPAADKSAAMAASQVMGLPQPARVPDMGRGWQQQGWCRRASPQRV